MLPVAFAGDEMKDSRKWSKSSIDIYQPLNHVWFFVYCKVPESVADAHGPRCSFESRRRIGQWNRNWYNALCVPSCHNQMVLLLARSYIYPCQCFVSILSLFFGSLTLRLQATRLGVLPCQWPCLGHSPQSWDSIYIDQTCLNSGQTD